eukprot:COSAG05_NODE_265_length_12666_cov_104.645739_11_plen_60_part_00
MEQDVRGGPASTRGRESGLLGGLLGGARQRQAALRDAKGILTKIVIAADLASSSPDVFH